MFCFCFLRRAKTRMAANPLIINKTTGTTLKLTAALVVKIDAPKVPVGLNRWLVEPT
jgi:hypothetical protein